VNQDHLAAPSEKARAAVRTLESLGFTYHDAELWKPPLGQRAAPSDGEREAFEAWYVDRHPYPVYPNPTWANAAKADDWEVWQAASAARSAEIQQLREALKELLAKCEVSDECQYGTLSTSFVAEIARAALKEPQ
jgi:hypothetical protein